MSDTPTEIKSGNITRRQNKRGPVKQNPMLLEVQKKMAGPLFYLVLFFVIIEDLFDIVVNLTFFLSFLATFSSFLISLVVFIYLYSEKIDWGSRKLALWLIAFLIELIPFTAIIPSYTIVFLLTKKIENSQRFKKKIGQFKSKSIIRSKRG